MQTWAELMVEVRRRYGEEGTITRVLAALGEDAIVLRSQLDEVLHRVARLEGHRVDVPEPAGESRMQVPEPADKRRVTPAVLSCELAELRRGAEVDREWAVEYLQRLRLQVLTAIADGTCERPHICAAVVSREDLLP